MKEQRFTMDSQNLQEQTDSLPQLRLVFDRSGCVVDASRPMLDYLKQDLEELKNLGPDGPICRKSHPDEIAIPEEERRRCREGEFPYESERRISTDDGNCHWYLFRYKPLYDDCGEVRRWICTATDIEDKKRDEDLRRKILGTSPTFLYTALPDGTVEYLSDRWIAYLGAPEESILNGASSSVSHSFSDASTAATRLVSTVHPDDLREWQAIATACKPCQFESRIRRSDGVYRWFLFDATPTLGKDLNVTRWYVVSIDIDERKHSEDASQQREQSLRDVQAHLSQANKMATVAELLAATAYEIYQPLGAVVSHGDACQIWLDADPPNVERASLAAQRIVRDAKAAAEVIRRIRILFRHALPKKVPLDLSEVLSEVLHLFADDIKRKRVVLESRVAPRLSVYADKVQMQQLFSNLLQNAIESMESVYDRPRTLTVESTTDEKRFVGISIRDSGPGLQNAEKIDEPFFTTKDAGMGMGLAISRSVVEAHGGTLQAQPNHRHGTVFTVRLPVIAEEPSIGSC